MFFKKSRPYQLPESWQSRVTVRESARARRLSLTVDPKGGKIVMVLPKRVSHAVADHFLLQNRDWIRAQEEKALTRVPFAPGSAVMFRGASHRLERFPDGRIRGIPEVREGVIYIPGLPEHFSRRTRDFIIEEARRILTERTHEKAALIGKKVSAVRLGDPKTRWGSCHAAGRISYSWRLILAPNHVLDYVVAHEVAHLIHRGHHRAFWECCASLTLSMKESRQWLKKNNYELLRYG